MKTLLRCEFCNQVIKFSEIGLKDKDIGNMCKKCYDWMHKEFLPLYRGEKPCL